MDRQKKSPDAVRAASGAKPTDSSRPTAENGTAGNSDPQGAAAAVDFLQRLRPGGPWVLTAIVPDGNAATITARTADEAAAFVRKHDGKRNLYYSVNPTRTALSKKAAKVDIAAIEYALADLDPADDETPEAAKRRYLDQLSGAFEPKPTVLIDSGNGVQGLWKLNEPISLGNPVQVENVKGRSGPQFSPEDQAKINDVEARIKTVMLRLGSKPGTQNIDRILRLPGTVNLPNAKKVKTGRVACPTKLLWSSGATYPLDAFPLDAVPPRVETNRPGTPDDGGQHAQQEPDDEDELERLIRDGAPVGQRSERVWWVVNELLRRGHAPAAVIEVLLDRHNRISEHVYDQELPRRYAERQVAKAKKEIKLATDGNGAPHKSPANIHVALLKLGVSVRYDKFADRTLIEGLADFGPVLDDAAVQRIWLLLEQRFRFRPSKDLLHTVIADTARLNGFHPVLDYLGGLRWDEVARIDRWLTTYGGAAATPYADAVGALMLTAAVRRLRKPGCKFDEMVVIENPAQGTDKSTALSVLAVRDEWFSDDLPLNMEGKRVIEALRGKWIVEAAELSGMRRADVEHLKAFLSRQTDRARMAYDRLVAEVPRSCVIVGTTNSTEYLRDTTGNRRFWPVLVGRFDVEALRRDRDQLWAEAAAREATGVSIRLDKRLWPAAAKEQAQRLAVDPYLEILQSELGDIQGKISSTAVWEILDVRPGQRSQDQNARVGVAMRDLGWRRPSKGKMVRIGGKLVMGYVRGEQPWATVTVSRSPEYGLHIKARDQGDMLLNDDGDI